MKKKICVITGSRADYGLLRPLIRKIQSSIVFDLQLIVTGSHISYNHGNTISEIKEDNFFINDMSNFFLFTPSGLDLSYSIVHL